MNRRINVRLTALMVVSVFIITAVVAFVDFRLSNNSVSAATLTDYGNVMSDYTIRDYNSMSETDIQAFLTRVNGCGNRNYSDYVYLSTTRPQYTWHWRDGHFVCISEERFEVAQPTRSWSSRYNVWYDDFTASPRFGDALAPGEGASAASIIYKAAQDYKINPKVIITFLQKEQGLITDPIPNSRDYGVAMGYNCPDSGRCPADENDRGFSTQVFHMAKRLDEYMSGDLNYFPGNTYIFDGQPVYIRNTATAGLYTYTPHISDKINLYRIYTGWFDGINDNYRGELEISKRFKEIDGEKTLGQARGNINCRIGFEGACVQAYENGVIIYGPSTGAWENYGDIRARYVALGSVDNIRLGFPKGPVSCYKKDNENYCVQAYERGIIVDSDTHGTWENFGMIRQRYVNLGSVNGFLGFPTGRENCDIGHNGACVQQFENGVIIAQATTGAWENYGDIRARYVALGSVDGVLGLPIGGTNCDIGHKDACVQEFEKGVIIYNPLTGAWESYGEIRRKHVLEGSVDGYLGFPISGVYLLDGIQTQEFQGGLLVSQ